MDPSISFIEDASEISNFAIIYLDTETTGLSARDEICQIAAYNGETSYNAYTVPTIHIKPAASAKARLIKKGEMFQHGCKLPTISSKTAIFNFLDYIESIKKQKTVDVPCKIILVGHNVIRFDAQKIKRLINTFGLYDRFIELVYGYSDTLRIFRKKLPERAKNKLSYQKSHW